MQTAFWAILIFLLLISIHEFGHFIVAKLSGVTVLEFALGMGPAIFKKEWHGTLYSLRVLPIGGYCKMEGEDSEATDDEGSLTNKPAYIRFLVMAAGATMNLLLGFVIFLVMLLPQSAITVPVIDTFTENSPAQQAGLLPGDRITKVNGTRINTKVDLSFQLARDGAQPVEVEYKRDGQTRQTTLTPAYAEQYGVYLLGFNAAQQPLTFGGKLQNAFYNTVFMVKITLVSFGDLITGKLGVDQLSGPAGIVGEIGNAAKQGMGSLLSLTALITINLGVFNLLPIPALDGGRIVFVLAEMISRKKIPPEKEGVVHFVGLMLLLGLMLFATWNDIVRFLQ